MSLLCLGDVQSSWHLHVCSNKTSSVLRFFATKKSAASVGERNTYLFLLLASLDLHIYHAGLFSSRTYGQRCVRDSLEDSPVIDTMFSIFSFMKLFTSLSLAFSPSIRGEAGDLGWKLGSRKGNVLHRRDSSDSYRVYRETTEGYAMPSCQQWMQLKDH